ncbi:MAG TPA: BON domain-containing protein [Planktothrix sp.]|jgi:osmotically-inducible protein OsmY
MEVYKGFPEPVEFVVGVFLIVGGLMRVIGTLSCLVIILSVGNAAFGKAPKADNTAQNQGSTQSDAVTAEKQGNKKSEVTVLAGVRKSIMADKDLSMDAKNVKILYSKGLVTLRGPVDSAEEKSKVEEIAKGCDGVTAVKNLLSVAVKSH